MTGSREVLDFDVVFVGGGPANLAGAIHLMYLARKRGLELEVALIEKGIGIGAHCLSGAVLDLRALDELVPDHAEKGCPIETADCTEALHVLTATGALRVPYIPSYMRSHGCAVISLSRFTAWLGGIAEEMGVNIFPGFAGSEVLFTPEGRAVVGVRTGDKGIGKDGKPKANHESGVDLHAGVTVFGEGPRGSLLRQLSEKLGIFSGAMPQVFETAVKEVIEVPPTSPFLSSGPSIVHTQGYPLGWNTKGGGFVYRMGDNRISLGLVVGLDYDDPYLEPYETFLRLKGHPFIARIIEGGRVLQQGAKTLCSGGLFTMPRLAVAGALVVGDSASMLSSRRLKGIHTAMKSGMLAAEAIVQAHACGDFSERALGHYQELVRQSWIHDELYPARNFSQALSKRGAVRYFHLAAQHLTGGRGIVDPLPILEDRKALKKIGREGKRPVPSAAPKCDGKLYVDKLTGVFLSGTQHTEDQPCHLIVHDADLCVGACFENYRNPCTRFCPGSVYEMDHGEGGQRRLRLNPSNCLHCKTCEIKDPYNNITWTCPEGGGGPRYSMV